MSEQEIKNELVEATKGSLQQGQYDIVILPVAPHIGEVFMPQKNSAAYAVFQAVDPICIEGKTLRDAYREADLPTYGSVAVVDMENRRKQDGMDFVREKDGHKTETEYIEQETTFASRLKQVIFMTPMMKDHLDQRRAQLAEEILMTAYYEAFRQAKMLVEKEHDGEAIIGMVLAGTGHAGFSRVEAERVLTAALHRSGLWSETNRVRIMLYTRRVTSLYELWKNYDQMIEMRGYDEAEAERTYRTVKTGNQEVDWLEASLQRVVMVDKKLKMRSARKDDVGDGERITNFLRWLEERNVMGWSGKQIARCIGENEDNIDEIFARMSDPAHRVGRSMKRERWVLLGLLLGCGIEDVQRLLATAGKEPLRRNEAEDAFYISCLMMRWYRNSETIAFDKIRQMIEQEAWKLPIRERETEIE